LFRVARFRDHLCHVQLTPDIVATLYDKPGRWMSDAELLRLREEIVAMAQAAMVGDLTYGVFRAERAPYENRIVVVVRHIERGEPVGFTAMPILKVRLTDRNIDVLHLGLFVIVPRYRRHGLQGLIYTLAMLAALRRLAERPVWISNVTAVPSVFGVVADYFLDTYPSYRPFAAPSPLHFSIAHSIMQDHRHEFGVGKEALYDPARFIIRGSYTGGSNALKTPFHLIPKHPVATVNAFCRTELDYERGDDFLQIGKVDSIAVARTLMARIAKDLFSGTAHRMTLWK
jgi:hypothetical protein